MGKFDKFLGDIFADGYKIVSFVAPLLSIFVALAKWQEWTIMEFRFANISHGWVFAPFTAWFLIAYVRRWNEYQKSIAHLEDVDPDLLKSTRLRLYEWVFVFYGKQPPKRAQWRKK